MWRATRQAERWHVDLVAAASHRDLEAVDWKRVIREFDEIAEGERIDWLSYCILTVERMLLIEHYPASAKKVRCWRDKAWLSRMDLHYRTCDSPGLVEHHRDELLAESWRIARTDAISTMAGLDATGRSKSEASSAVRAGSATFPPTAPMPSRRSSAVSPRGGVPIPSPTAGPPA